MKKSHYLRLFAYEPGILLAMLFYGGWIEWFNISHFHEDATGYLGFLPDLIFAFTLAGISLVVLFKTLNEGAGSRNASGAPAGNLEFFFTRAVSRHSLFYARSSRYLLACLFPVLVTLAFSYSRPLTRVRLSYEGHQQAAMERYYLAHYHDAFLQRYPADGNGNKRVDAVFPRGQVNQAFFALVFICCAALLYQFITFIFWGRRWVAMAIFLGFISFPSLYIFWMVMPSRTTSYSIFDSFHPAPYEKGLAWVTQHTPLTLLILALLAVVTQTYCCRRYITTEIIS